MKRQLALSWGIEPVLMPYAESTDEMIAISVDTVQKAGYVKNGDIVIVTAGVPAGISGTTNMMKVHLVGSCLITGVGVGTEHARGNLCICRNMNDIENKFKTGDVLVVPQTNNKMLPYIQRAAAVVTEEAGTSSHAAVVGLSTNKAVIVAALGATKILEDGIFVSVDCKRGIVQNLTQ